MLTEDDGKEHVDPVEGILRLRQLDDVALFFQLRLVVDRKNLGVVVIDKGHGLEGSLLGIEAYFELTILGDVFDDVVHACLFAGLLNLQRFDLSDGGSREIDDGSGHDVLW